MTGKQRILDTLEGKPTDCLPLMPITMMYAGDTIGAAYQSYATDYRVLAEAQLATAEKFGFDYVSAISDPCREAADLGAAIEWFPNQPPALKESEALLHEKGVLAKLALPDPRREGSRMLDRINAVALLAKQAGERLVVEGWVEGPCAMAADLRGVNGLMLDFHDDEDFIGDLFEFCIAMELRFAAEQAKAGATLMGVGDAAASLVGPKTYEKWVLPYEQKLFAGLRALGVKTRLHICGNTRRILKGMGQVGADMVDLDYPSPMQDGRAAMGERQVLSGNLDPVRVIKDGTPESVYEAVATCHRESAPHYIVCAGCEIPRGTPEANLHSMGRYAREHSN